MRLKAGVLFIVCAIAAFGLVGTADAKGKADSLIAHRVLQPAKGGHVRAADGAAIYVPKGALSRESLVTITRLRHGRYDFHINASWTGRVLVTLPRRHHATYVVHQLGKVWVM